MNITKLIVSYQQTENLGDFSNCKPSVSIEVTLTEDDDPSASLAAAQQIVRSAVQREVDDALEDHGRAPRYTTEPRYALFTRYQRVRDGGVPDLVVIGPVDAAYPGLSRSYKGFRLPAIRRQAAEHYQQYLLIDTLAEPDALAPLLAQIAAEDAALEAERQRKEQEYQERMQRYQQAQEQKPTDDEDDDDEEGG